MAKPVTQRIKLYINGKEIDNTLTSIRKNLIKYKRAANKATQGSEDWKKYNKVVSELEVELKQAYAAQKAFRQDTKLTTAGLDKSQQAVTNFTSSFSNMVSGFKSGDLLQVQEGFNGVKTGIKGATKAAWSFIATPIGALIAGLVGIGLATKEWLNYNNAVIKAVETTTQITGLTDAAANDARIQAETLAETYGGDFEKNLETAKKLVQQFGISYNEAFKVIEEGLQRGQGKNEEYFDSLNEYGTFFKQAGFSATEFKNIISTGYDLGIYKDKLPDAIKEADLAIKEQTKSTKDALVNAFGTAFTEDLLKKVRTGKITTKEALAEIASESKKANLNQQQYAQLTADVFKGAGEDAGGALKVFEAINTSLNKQQRELTESEQLIADQAEATRQLKNVSSALFLASDKGWGLLVGKAKLFGTKILIKVLEAGVDVYNWLVDLNNESGIFSAILTGLGKAATSSFRVIGILLSNAWNGFKSLGEIIAGIVTFDYDRIKAGFQKGISVIPNIVKDIKEEVVKDVNDIYDSFTGKNKMKRLNLSDFTADNTSSDPQEGDTKTVNGVKYVFKNGSWVKVKSSSNDSSADELTDEDKKIIASKKKLKEFLDAFEAEQKIIEEAKKVDENLREEEEETLRLEAKYLKMAEDAGYETILEAGLKEAHEAELAKIQDKWNEKRIKAKEKADAKFAKLDKKAKEDLVAAEQKLERAVANAKMFGLRFLRGLVNKKGLAYKALLGLEKALAISQVITSTSKANAAATANEIKIPYFLSPGVPNPMKAISLASTAKMISANKINAGIEIASIVGSTLRSFDKGGYTFSGPYSGGLDGIGGQLAMIHPDEYMIPKPVMQMPEVPVIVEYLEAKRTGKPINSFLEGGSKETSLEDVENPTIETLPNNSQLNSVLNQLLVVLSNGLKINYTLQDEVERQKLEEELQTTLDNAKS